MRKTISKYLKNNHYLIHADMWNIDKFPTRAEVINVGLGESNLLNIAGGLASQKNTVFVYGVAGFIIHRYEQLKFSCKYFGSETGKIIIINAGKVGYGRLGIGHTLDDDEGIMKLLNIPFFAPETINDLLSNINYIETQDTGIFYIQLGKDF